MMGGLPAVQPSCVERWHKGGVGGGFSCGKSAWMFRWFGMTLAKGDRTPYDERWERSGVSKDFQTTALLDQLNAIEAHMDEVRPKRKTVLANLLFLGAVLLWLELVGAGWVWSALGVMAMGLRYVVPFAKLRSLGRQRDRLLGQTSSR